MKMGRALLRQKIILKHEHTEKDWYRGEQMNLLGHKYEYGRYSLRNAGILEKAKKLFKTLPSWM